LLLARERRVSQGVNEREAQMTLGLRPILLLIAVVLFVYAALSSTNELDLIAYGLACTAGALLVGDLGLGRGRLGRRRL